ncbi:MAG: hypothetical protein HC847_22400 [Hydrococcus sp. RU_2_2]|nr:hypothetical protein [Hydrococcus sp. RU_2_2]NJP19056.1 hypothetical protein [Hydrococcus sp. CRU_1_1]NJQ97948.1 hypothetical protein [Hydrococcus sp. CSU_1_8]
MKSLDNLLTLLPSIAALILASEVAIGQSPRYAIANPNINLRNQVENTRPFNLVHLGYQGYFQDDGIPSNGAFRTAIKHRLVTAETLIESAIKKGRLSPDALNNQDYVDAVEVQLELILKR